MQGGRGKAGLIQFADNANEAREKVAALRSGDRNA